MSNSKFLKPPLSATEKEKKAEEFLNFLSTKDNKIIINEEKKTERIFKKESVKPLALRFPISLAEDITEISAITGLSVNAVCVELLRPAAKNKLKELKE
jgi:hypothetical protein